MQRIRLVEAILLQLFRVAVKLRMARLEGAAAIGKVAAVADAAKPATAETSISTTVEEPAVTEAGPAETATAKPSATESPATAKSAAVESTETAAAAKSSAAKTRRNLFAGRSKNHRHANAGKRDGGHLFQARNIRHERATLLLLYCLAPALAETVAKEFFAAPAETPA